MPVVENWMLGMCDVADCINDVRDPETIRFSDFQNSKTYVKTKFTFIKSVYPLTINLIKIMYVQYALFKYMKQVI